MKEETISRNEAILRVFVLRGQKAQEAVDRILKKHKLSHPSADSSQDAFQNGVRKKPFDQTIDYFRAQKDKYLLLVTKSTAEPLKGVEPSEQIIVSFSVNNELVSDHYERGAPPSMERLKAAANLMHIGWRVRLRLDPIVDGYDYKPICYAIRWLDVERVTVGSLRHYARVYKFTPVRFPGLSRGDDGRLRYTMERCIEIYQNIASWLGFQPALCKETKILWAELGWKFEGCNCIK